MTGLTQVKPQDRINREIALGRAIAHMYIAAQHVSPEAILSVEQALSKPSPAMCFGFNEIMKHSPYDSRCNLEGLVEDKAAMLWRHLSKDDNPSWHPRNSDRRVLRVPNVCMHCHQDLQRHKRPSRACPLFGPSGPGSKTSYSLEFVFEPGGERSAQDRRKTDSTINFKEST